MKAFILGVGFIASFSALADCEVRNVKVVDFDLIDRPMVAPEKVFTVEIGNRPVNLCFTRQAFHRNFDSQAMVDKLEYAHFNGRVVRIVFPAYSCTKEGEYKVPSHSAGSSKLRGCVDSLHIEAIRLEEKAYRPE